jgi:hypothetical protein
MARASRLSNINHLASDVLTAVTQNRHHRTAALADARDEIIRLERREYGTSLRGRFDRSEVREIVSEARAKAWPDLNRAPVRLGSLREFAARASSLGADFRIAKMPWPSGLALFGFYLSRGSGLQKRPLICVNAAHHRAAVGMAFAHEVGHHVTASLFAMRAQPPLPSLYTGYESHFDDPLELAADITVSLGMYPRPVALKFLCEIESIEAAEQRRESPAGEAALDYVRRQYGLNISTLSVQKQIQYQLALIHFTKLRQALLQQFDI